MSLESLLSRLGGTPPASVEPQQNLFSGGGFRLATEEPEGGFGTTFQPTQGQRARERAALTSVRNGMQDIGAAGMQEEYQAFRAKQQPGVLETLTLPIFDLLSGGLYSSAAFFKEIVQSGDGALAFKKAASELANALPGIDEDMVVEWGGERPERPTWGDIFKQSGMGPVGAAAGGFVFDILLDPTTWVPGLNLVSVGGKAAKLAGRGVRATGLLDRPVAKSVEAFGRKWLGKGFVKDYDLAQTEMGRLFIGKREAEEAAKADATDTLFRDVVENVSGTLDRYQRVLLNTYLDDDVEFGKQLQALVAGQVVPAEWAQDLTAGFNRFRTHFKDILQRDLQETPHGVPGVLDPTQARTTYVPGAMPATPRTGRMSEAFVADAERRGILTGKPPVETTSPYLTSSRTPTQSYHKGYQTEQERLLAAIPTEMDVAVNAVHRGLSTVQAESFSRLVDSTISDAQIAARVVADVPSSVFEGAGRSHPGVYRRYGNVLAGRETENLVKTSRQYGLPTEDVLKSLDDNVAEYGYRTFRKRRGKDTVAAWVLPTEIADALDNTQRILTEPDALHATIKAFDKVQGMWKMWALFSPGYHARNLYSNLYQNWLSGVGRDYKNILSGDMGDGFFALHRYAAQIQGGFERTVDMPSWLKPLFDGKAPNIQIKKRGGGFYTGDEILALAKEHGVLNHGLFAADLPDDIERTVLRQIDGKRPSRFDASKLEQSQASDLTKAAMTAAQTGDSMMARAADILGPSGTAMRSSRVVGRIVENNARLAHFIDRMQKGMDPAQAGQSVKKWLFDYGNLSDFERQVMRRALPFYAWLRFNIPLQFHAIMTNPSRYSKVPKLMQEIEGMTEDWEGIPTPDYFQELHAVRLPLLRRDKPVYINPNLPFQDLNRMNWKDVMGSLTPFVKVFFEQYPEMGYSMFTDRNIEEYPGQAARVLPGLSRKQEVGLETLVPPLAKYVTRPIKAWQKGEVTEWAATEMAGVKLIANDVPRTIRGQRLHEDEIMRQFRRKAREEGRLPQ